MTPEESQMLNDLADKVAKTPSPAHDVEAEQFIRTRIGSRPDALYIMTQTVLIQNLALEHAKQQILELQQRAAQAPGAVAPAGGSFLGGQRPSGPGYGASALPPPPQPSYGQAPPGYQPPLPGGPPSFLRSAASTAAGVAAGALAFEGIRSLFGGMGHLGGFGGGMSGGFLGGAPTSETVINNYYDSPEQSGQDEGDSGVREASDQDVDNSAQNADDSGGYSTDDSADDSAGDSGADDSGGDDSGGGDSGGGDWV